ncbi:hypothetical protein D8674_022523 [Pyrus ussuriensis x Pyrus communis]|uniref:Uncharacterized protein n=1 Tax=Pyrus ussuriensis x Pyrus communis TaxID=2448454 RepID=A0A5N5GK63_9ROSA|nr:hypothetical protein D8674_022523 [Pyrus ussuriensis x Pyrus communis]
MSIKESCLMMERAIYAKGEFQDVPSESHEMWELLDEVSDADKGKLLAKKLGKMARGGGGWPSTAASLP